MSDVQIGKPNLLISKTSPEKTVSPLSFSHRKLKKPFSLLTFLPMAQPMVLERYRVLLC